MPDDGVLISRALRERARALGADVVGIAPAVPPESSEGGPAAYREWVRNGMHGGLDYMARSPEDRCAITRWYPDARSVVVCAFSCHTGTPPPGADTRRGRLARYALPPDYHDELKDRMRRLLESFPALNGKVFTDTSPVLERHYARWAGIGWVGKNTMILSREIGSFFLLAGLAVDAPLEYDAPLEPRCGSCTRCLDACPTRAFPKPNVLDAARCVANFTVEQRKRPIPEELRAGHGNWIFGCDVCQDVCPWNRFAVKGSALTARLEPALDLEGLARLSPAEFNRRYKGTPLRRTGHTALVRNALLAMGNSGDRRHLPLLEKFQNHETPLLAEQARWSLRKITANLLE